MDKIASPNELARELRLLLAYAESDHPSREKIAESLEGLAASVAGASKEASLKSLPRDAQKIVTDFIVDYLKRVEATPDDVDSVASSLAFKLTTSLRAVGVNVRDQKGFVEDLLYFTKWKPSIDDRKVQELVKRYIPHGKRKLANASDVRFSKEARVSARKPTNVPDKHQLKILRDTVKNPSKGLLGGPDAEEAEEILREKFKYTDAEIRRLKKASAVREAMGKRNA